jgi:hypothetical protein
MPEQKEPRNPWVREEGLSEEISVGDVRVKDEHQSIDDNHRGSSKVSSEDHNRPNILSFIIGPALVVTLAVSVLYLIWALYCNSYFYALSLPNQYANYQNIPIMFKIVSIVLSVFLISAGLFLLPQIAINTILELKDPFGFRRPRHLETALSLSLTMFPLFLIDFLIYNLQTINLLNNKYSLIIACLFEISIIVVLFIN